MSAPRLPETPEPEWIEAMAQAIEPSTFALPRIRLNQRRYEHAYNRARAAYDALRRRMEGGGC